MGDVRPIGGRNFTIMNEYEIRGPVTAIFLAQADGSFRETIIDTTELERVMSLGKRWFCSSVHGRCAVMAHAVGNGASIYLSRFILGITDPQVIVDYANHDSLDNRRENLLPLTKAGNGLYRAKPNKNNTSGLIGVTWHKPAEKWMAQISHRGKNIYLGLHHDPFVAAEIVQKKREELIEQERSNHNEG